MTLRSILIPFGFLIAQGNLEDLLGTVAPYVPYPEGETDKFRIPNMTLEDSHPYHLIVVQVSHVF